MSNAINRFKIISVSFLVGMFITTPVRADDIEIYVGDTPSLTEVTSNVLFILDTSGSMSNTVSIEVPVSGVYDASVSYTGTYSTSRIYYSDTHDVADIDGNFREDRNRCRTAALDFNVFGIYRGQVAQYDGDNWIAIHSTDRDVECGDDNGTHGKYNSSSDKYAQSGRSSAWGNKA